LVYRLGIENSYGTDPTDTLILFPLLPHHKSPPLVLSTETEQFLDRDAAVLFKKKVTAEFHKKKDKTRPPSNLDAPNVVLNYDRNFFAFWMSSIKLSAQLFKSAKLEFKCLTHIDDRLLAHHSPSNPSQVMISASSFLLPFPSFRFEGAPPPSIEQQQINATEEEAIPSGVTWAAELPDVHYTTSPTLQPSTDISRAHHPSSPTPTPEEPFQHLQQQLQALQERNKAQDLQHQADMATITSSISQLTRMLAGLQPTSVPIPTSSSILPDDPMEPTEESS
jgi:hypothetical protein